MKKILTLLIMGLFTLVVQAQTTMNIYQNNGTVVKLPIATIDSLTFTSTPAPAKLNIFQFGGGIIVAVLANIDSITYTVSPNTTGLPILSTLPVGNIQATSAVSGGNIVSDGGNPVTLRGVCWNTTGNPTIANSKTINGGGSGNYSSSLSGLSSGTLYYVRAYATNASGTAYGNEWQFTTSTSAGSITALNCGSASNSGTLTAGTAASGVSSSIPYTGGNGGTYSGQTVNSTGVTGLIATLTAGSFNNGSGTLTYSITGTPATSGTAVFALNIGGQICAFSRFVNIASGITSHSCGAINIHNPLLNYGTITDHEGNEYKTIQIGTQIWMAENLRTSKYRNGDTIPNVKDQNIWNGLTTDAYCHYNNTITYECPYGKLYNWYVLNDNRNICPTGWHIPSDTEWTIMANYLSDREEGNGGALKSTSRDYWLFSGTATNSSGFSGLGGGFRNFNGIYRDIYQFGFWWTKTGTSPQGAVCYSLSQSSGLLTRSQYGKSYGFSVRCVKD